jgi:hypothetical protein
MIAWRPAAAAMDQERFEVRPLIASLRSRWKRGAERNALGRSRGGFSTKINVQRG